MPLGATEGGFSTPNSEVWGNVTNKKQPRASVISKNKTKIDDFPSGVVLVVFIARTLLV
jgi:hypothetical protein